MKKITVLGSGRVGRIIARDLADEPTFDVTVADLRADALSALGAKMRIRTAAADLSHPGVIRELLSSCDMAVGALPGHLGFFALTEVLAAKKPYVDISFMAEDPRQLRETAKAASVPVLYDFGVAPGMSNLIAAMEAKRLSKPVRIAISVGGLPRTPRPPWGYEAPFSPADVVEEYIRPARVRVDGRTVDKPALSETMRVDMPGVGELESFLTDGLRSLLDTVDCPNMEERTLRYPGHRDKIQLLLDTGLLSETPVKINDVTIVPADLTRRLLEAAWQTPKTADELTVMQITAAGLDGNRRVERTVHLYDETDRTRNETSMARTTGFPAALAVRALAQGALHLSPGIHPPESVASDEGFVTFLFEGLAKRNVRYNRLDERVLPD